MAPVEEKYLPLPGNRTLAYEENGNPNSSTVLIFFHGVFGVGSAARPSKILSAKGVHFVAPTLPGWGNTSPLPSSSSFASGLASDITQLINHLHPNDNELKLYVAGGSFGTVPAQILYGAPYDVFPAGKHIAGLLLLAPFSPFYLHTNYMKAMTWSDYIGVGPPAKLIPFNIMPRLARYFLAPKLSTTARAQKLVRQLLFDKMKEDEKEVFARWREEQGVSDGELEQEMATNMVRSVAKTWEGFYSVTSILHSDWGGFHPDGLDEEHSRHPVLIVASKGDTRAPSSMADYLAVKYKNATLKILEGGHIVSLFYLDEIFTDLLKSS
jgi:pimeloyl-ACP methyl ester carboxylesterase